VRRREFLTLAGGAALAWPIVAVAQKEDPIRRVGVLMAYTQSDPVAQSWHAAFQEELRKLGWSEGRNVRIATRWALDTDAALIKRHAQELAALKPDVIFAPNTAATALILQQTRSIPVVFATVIDPIGSGFVASLPQPGGNVTGFTFVEPTIGGKWLELLKEIAPRVARVAFLYNPPTAPYADYYLNPFKAVAASLGVEAIAAPVHDASELEAVVAAQARAPNGGLIAMPDAFMNAHGMEIISLAARHGLPAVYSNRFFTQSGGLLSYGSEVIDNYRSAANYVHLILRGTNPGRLPIQAPATFKLIANLNTAKALGLDVPPSLLALADELIE